MKQYLIMLALLAAAAGRAQAQVNPKEKFSAALATIQSSYVDSVRDEALVDAAIRGMLTQLDPHSQYYDRQQIAARNEAMSGSFVGIGIQYLVQHDTAYVTQVLSGGPAEKAGLLAGDRITKIDDIRLAEVHLSNLEVMKKIRGAINTPVKLEVYRGLRTAPLALTLTRGPVADKSVKAAYMVSPQIGYISLAIFSQTTRPEMDKALQSLKQQGMQDLILDLQGNGGGYVQAAIGVADEFLKRDQLVYYTVGQDKGKDYYYAAGTGNFLTGRLVVLIDQATASASEIMVSSVQDWDRAVVVGRRSFGKGLMQRPIQLFDGSVLELSGARYYAPTGRSLQKPYKGVNYQSELSNRYTSGELFNPGVISFAKAAQFKTLVGKRPVYGGMGIMPDVYVPLDTVQNNTWVQQVAGAGLVNQAALQVVDKQRATLLATYPTAAAFSQRYTVPAAALDALVASAASNGLKQPAATQGRPLAHLALELKGRMASQLYAEGSAYLQVVNQGDPSFQQACQLLANPAQYARCLQGPQAKK